MPSFEERLQPVLEVAAANAESVDDEARFTRENGDALAASGLMGLTLPGTVGGLGWGRVGLVGELGRVAWWVTHSARVGQLPYWSGEGARGGG